MAIREDILDELLIDYKNPEDLLGKDGLLKQLQKQLIERALDGEMHYHLGYEKHDPAGNNSGNSRNGKTNKIVKTASGEELKLTVPRDRAGSFEPVLVKKRQNRLSGFEDNVISLYGRGMTVRDIQEHLKELYGTEVSPEFISTVTDSVLEDVVEWRNRPLSELYPFIYIDGFRVNCRNKNGKTINQVIYVVYGIDIEGHKEVMGLWLAETEGAKFWMQVMNEIRTRGVKDCFVICADGLTGLSEAVGAIFPDAIFQTCVVHVVRNSLKYVPHKEKKVVATDLRKIYQADTIELAELAMEEFEKKWSQKYFAIVKSWRSNWDKIIPFFDFSPEIRKIIYTTNIIESLNGTLRKAVKNRRQFSTEDAVMKVLYLAIKNVSKKWTMPIRNWGSALNQFAIMFPDRFSIG